MPHKPVFRALFTMFVLLAATLTILPAASAQVPHPIGVTVLEGMALDDSGEPLYKQNFLQITVRDRAGETVVQGVHFDPSLGGLYRIELKAGIYEIFINPYGSAVGHIRPLRLNGVMLKAGKINKLNITMHEGSTLEEIGAPIEPTTPAIVISEKLDSLQKQVDALKAQVAALKAK